MQSRYIKGDKEAAIVAAIGHEEFFRTLSTLRKKSIFIWSKGDLESYYSQKSKALSGTKDIKALELSYLLQDETQNENELFLHMEEIASLVKLILAKPSHHEN